MNYWISSVTINNNYNVKPLAWSKAFNTTNYITLVYRQGANKQHDTYQYQPVTDTLVLLLLHITETANKIQKPPMNGASTYQLKTYNNSIYTSTYGIVLLYHLDRYIHSQVHNNTNVSN